MDQPGEAGIARLKRLGVCLAAHVGAIGGQEAHSLQFALDDEGGLGAGVSKLTVGKFAQSPMLWFFQVSDNSFHNAPRLKRNSRLLCASSRVKFKSQDGQLAILSVAGSHPSLDLGPSSLFLQWTQQR
jgi:hypothetical protein